MPSQRHHELGDLFVRVNVTFPTSLPEAAIPLLEAALPPRNLLKPTPKASLVEDVELTELDARQERERAKKETNGGGDDEMDEDEHPRVQCANQ
jgi:DnaJ family protein A protein 2